MIVTAFILGDFGPLMMTITIVILIACIYQLLYRAGTS